ncbi:helix-turn-helix transcriptional regulator [Sphingomonas psychrotolerans]|nr:helix-turn-helix transcriptional regulator [Sphingomonas psychrotolerans]
MAQLLDGVILIDPTGTILSANAAALRMHGVRTAAGLGTTVESYAERFSLRGQDHRALKRREYPLFRLLAGESFPDLIVEVAPAGEDDVRWVHQVRDVTMDDDGGEPDCLALVISDVSDRFDAEARFRALFEANPAPALIVRLRDQRITEANPGFLGLTGFQPDQLAGRTLFGLDLLQDLPDSAAFREQVEAGQIVPQTEAELLVVDGSRRRVLFAGQPVDVTGEDALLLTFADLEPWRRAQNALAESERQLSSMFEMAPVAMAITSDADHRVRRVNAAFRHLTGFHEEETVGRTVDELQLWEDGEQREAAEKEVKEYGNFRNREGHLLPKGGAPADCLVSADTISVEGAPCVLWTYEDITERRRSEQELAAAIDEVMKDASWLSRSILDKVANLRRPGAPIPPVDLSPREREVLELICDDLDDAAIAQRLALSRNTVRNHVARLYTRIGVNRRSAAVIWGRERGMGRRSE